MSRMWETISKRRIRFDTTFSCNYFTTQNFESEKCGKKHYHSIFKILCCKVIATECRIKSNSPLGNSFPHTRHSTVRSKKKKKKKKKMNK